MRLPDGTNVDVVALENNRGQLLVTLEALWPEGLKGKVQVRIQALISAISTPLNSNAASLDTFIPSTPAKP